MNKPIDLPRCTIVQRGDVLVIQHKQTKAQTSVPASKLDAWAVARLREIFSAKGKA